MNEASHKSQVTSQKYFWVMFSILILVGFGARLLPHPANFTPIGALALFGGLYLPRRWSIIVPFAAMLLSDVVIGFYNWKIMIAVYASFIIMGLIGLAVRKNKKFAAILGGTLLGSIIFFVLTNAAVWIFGTMYTHNISGLVQSYTMALPFFKNSLLGDLFYIGVFVGILELLVYHKKTVINTKIYEQN